MNLLENKEIGVNQIFSIEEKVTLENVIIPEILFITSYPPRECGIATYSEDLISSLERKFHLSFGIKICALESDSENSFDYPERVEFIWNTDDESGSKYLLQRIVDSETIHSVVIQHEFGLFGELYQQSLVEFIQLCPVPVIVVFHTVLPGPNSFHRKKVIDILSHSSAVIVMTGSARDVLVEDYGIGENTISIIEHGTHVVRLLDKEQLKLKYGFYGKYLLSTFGLISSGKGIEMSLKAISKLISNHPEILFLIIGRTHPGVIKNEGESYRNSLIDLVRILKLENHVRFINYFLPLPELLEYLQMTDTYLFTSRDPNQAVSGTFAYALSCGCPVISTPIPHALDVLNEDRGIVVEFDNPDLLALSVLKLLENKKLRDNLSSNSLQRISTSSWSNSAILHAKLFLHTLNKEHSILKIQELSYDFKFRLNSLETGVPVSSVISDHVRILPIESSYLLRYTIPDYNLLHLREMTTGFGILQFSRFDLADINSGYTLDDNARALMVYLNLYEKYRKAEFLEYIQIYLDFISFCSLDSGGFCNYVDYSEILANRNNQENLDDSNGRAIWALGYLISKSDILPNYLALTAENLIQNSFDHIRSIRSPRALSFITLGMHYRLHKLNCDQSKNFIIEIGEYLCSLYTTNLDKHWFWFEDRLTYANSILSEAMLCVYQLTGKDKYRIVALKSFKFLLETIFVDGRIRVISNRTWLVKGNTPSRFGEQPIDVAYTILALEHFFLEFKDPEYLKKIKIAFSWFLGNNSISKCVYNDVSGGCFDGLEEFTVNINQGAESTLSYFLARQTVDRFHFLTV